MNKVLVIGNGFDLDLGLKTKYIDFWNSSVFKHHRNEYGGMVHFFEERANEDSTWFDIEALIREYVSLHSNKSAYDFNHVNPNDFQKEQTQFEKIRTSLAQYLEQEVDEKVLNDESAAAEVFKVITKIGFSSIYSFNYTDLHKIAEKLHVPQTFEYKDVHGRASDNSLILGINDDVEIVDNYEFTYKTFSPYYHSVSLKFDLEEAGEVVIFGLSMGDIDYPYFQDFFRNICDPTRSRRDSKHVTIFTYDEKSRLSILRTLRQKNSKGLSSIFGQNDFTLIRTGVEDDKNKIEEFVKRMNEEAFIERKRLQR